MEIVLGHVGWWIAKDDYPIGGPYAEYADAKRAMDEFERADAEDAAMQLEK